MGIPMKPQILRISPEYASDERRYISQLAFPGRNVLFFGFHAKLSHLAIEIRAVQAQARSGLADVAAALLDQAANIFDLELAGGLGQGQIIVGRHGRLTAG